MTKLLTTDEVAEMTGLSPETLAQWRWLKKEIPFVRLGRNAFATDKATLTPGLRRG